VFPTAKNLSTGIKYALIQNAINEAEFGDEIVFRGGKKALT